MNGDFTVLNELPKLLTNAGYDRSIVDDVERALNGSDGTIIPSRMLLENFVRTSAQMEKAIRFTGDATNFGEVLDFSRNRSWLTEQEHRFVRALYGLLSDSGAHPGQSIMDPAFARHAVLHSIWLIMRRLKVRPARPFTGYGGTVNRFRLAESFLKGVRTGILSGPAFEVEFDQDLMQLTRERLVYDDIQPLMSVIKSETASADLRSNCASLILSPRCYRKPKDDNWPRTIAELDRYCAENLRILPWQVSQAIALALANRTNHPDRLLDYLDWISPDSELVELSLAELDAYNGGVEKALEYYTYRVQNADIPLGGCVWEVFYISHRPGRKRASIGDLLERRLKQLEPGRLRTFLQSAAKKLASAGR